MDHSKSITEGLSHVLIIRRRSAYLHEWTLERCYLLDWILSHLFVGCCISIICVRLLFWPIQMNNVWLTEHKAKTTNPTIISILSNIHGVYANCLNETLRSQITHTHTQTLFFFKRYTLTHTDTLFKIEIISVFNVGVESKMIWMSLDCSTAEAAQSSGRAELDNLDRELVTTAYRSVWCRDFTGDF